MTMFTNFLAGMYTDCRMEPLPYHYLRKGWETYLFSLNMDEAAEFSCPKCGDIPDVVLFDGTLLACRRDQMLSTISVQSRPEVDYGSSHRDRVLLLKSQRERFLPFLLSTPETPVSWDKIEASMSGFPQPLVDLVSTIIIPADHENVCPFLRLL